MAITKRTQKEIEKDCKRIREAAETATSIRDLERMTSLSYAEINTTMSKHPIIFKKLKEQIALNKQHAEDERKRQKEEEALAKAEEKARLRAEKKLNKKEEKQQLDKEEHYSSTEEMPKKNVEGFVIDASITGVEDLRNTLSKICTAKSKIILTSITIKELERMQKLTGVKGVDARYILALAAENYDIFENVLIDETYDTPDDCIIQYCSENKEGITLLTSDKAMALKARMYEVEVRYLKQTHIITNNRNQQSTNSKIRTLFPARRIGNQLLISEFQTDTRSICVCSNGLEYEDGVRELKIGDDVYVATKKLDYITFAHYKIISLYSENNCELIYSKRIYDHKNIDLPKASYKSFIKNFKVRHDL